MSSVKQAYAILMLRARQYERAAESLKPLLQNDVMMEPVKHAAKRHVSASARRKMRLAQRARWARVKAAQRNNKPKLVKKAA